MPERDPTQPPPAQPNEPTEPMRPRFDLAALPRCGAKTRGARGGRPCQHAAGPNGRCRLHGGASTGPRTPEGKARARRGNWKHGRYSAEARAKRRAQAARQRELLADFAAVFVGAEVLWREATGRRVPAGLERRARKAAARAGWAEAQAKRGNWKHGERSAAAIRARKALARHSRQSRATLAHLAKGLP